MSAFDDEREGAERGGSDTGAPRRALEDDFPFRLDRTAISFAHLGDEDDDNAFWHSRTPEERMLALEFLRQVHYGYDPATERLQRTIEIIDLADLVD